MTTKQQNIKFVFFGTEPLAGDVLDELEKAGFLPSLVVAAPDKTVRKKILSPPEKMWARVRGISVIQPTKLNETLQSEIYSTTYDLFIVASYGKILPKALLAIPKHGILNVHPSLLPRLRGPSPIRSAILNDERETGVTIMLMDDKVDHGPIVAQKKIAIPEWPPHTRELEKLLAREGGRLLTKILPHWTLGDIETHEQNHLVATYCKKITKEDGLIDLTDDPYKNLLKIRALQGLQPFAFFERGGKKIRVVITDAHLAPDGTLVLDRVIPEGKKEMSYADFARSGAVPLNT